MTGRKAAGDLRQAAFLAVPDGTMALARAGNPDGLRR